MSQKFYTVLLFMAFMATGAFAQNPTRTITDDDLVGGRAYTWSADTTYLLDGFVFLEDGGILTIEPGTVIKGLASPSNNEDLASTLIISKNAQIFARGTALEPIVFTAEIDNLDPNDPVTTLTDRGLWGGVVILGNAPITDNTQEQVIEGLPQDDPRALYGGSVADDNSGELRYVSIRHGGAELAPGEEINGLSLGGVGSGTTLEFIEVLANSDDGIEFFGGTVNLRYGVVAFCGDDGYDWDTGWLGKGQFWLNIQGADAAGNGAEMDGAKPDANTPSSNPTIYNATYIGSGADNTTAGLDNEHALLFRDATRGFYGNSIFTDFANFAIQVEDLASGVDSRQYMEDGELTLANNLWFDFGAGSELSTGANGFIQATDGAEDPNAQFLIDHLVANGNAVEDPQINGISRMEGSGAFDPRPAFGGPAYSTDRADLPEDDDFFITADYKGAFGSTLWIRGWSALDFHGLLPEAEEITITDDDLIGGETYTWTSDNVYLLDGFVFLEEGGTLNIEPGTVIKGKQTPSTNDLASTLIITRGAQIFAKGTRSNPIVFTAEIDNLDPDNPVLFPNDRGLWGGVVILGNASITDNTAEQVIEGLPQDDPRALYGGSDDTDDSGEMKYVSIRHGGAELAPGEEINGLSLGGVGSGTSLEFIEVLANSDDGIEFFGGTVNLKYGLVAYCGDDGFDWDTGYRGKGQFWFNLQGADAAGNGAEMDGAKPDSNTPSSNPQVYNATYIGSGANNTTAGLDNEHALLFRDGTRGRYANSIFTDFANFAIQVEDLASGVDSRQYMEDGELVIENNVWFGFGAGDQLSAGAGGFIQATDGAEDPDAQFLVDHLADNGNAVADPQIANISRTTDGMLNPTADPNGPAYNTDFAVVPDDPFYTPVEFKGAFCSQGSWAAGWSALSFYNILDPSVPYTDFTPEFACEVQEPERTVRVIKDEDLEGGQSYTWSADTIYQLDGFVFLESGGTLTIEPGTVIKGQGSPSTADLASTLIIARGAQIFAEGTRTNPIVFTAEIDNLDADNPTLFPNDRGLWGGLVILGNASITDNTAEQVIEGLPQDDPRALYGGSDDMDNSGVLRYVSIRHGGAELAPGEEINGLSLGGVGNGTTLEFIEVLANSDDGIEFFGGTVNLKYGLVAYCGDDGFDWDTGYRGKGQFWFNLQGADAAGNGAEMDGAKPDSNTPSSNPQVYNATYIGSGANNTTAGLDNEHALLFRDGTRGRYANSIFTDFANFAIQVEDLASGVDSRQYMEDGELVLENNIWFGFGAGDQLSAGMNGFIQATDGAEDPDAQFLVDHLADNGNAVDDPLLTGISRNTDGGLDPRPAMEGPAYTTALADFPGDDFYSPVIYKGAFCASGAWVAGWTALDFYGVLADVDYADSEGATGCDVSTSTESLVKQQSGIKLFQNVPNPVNDQTMITFELPNAAVVSLDVFDMNGRLVSTLVDREQRGAGEYTETLNASNLEDGIYIYRLTAGNVVITKPLVVNR